ncbi:MAG: hypothetical protein MJE12_15755, partial [Alphaproteobacteria bacterium]|nr:hypothetical protein [Alphaproteobacteria bacterium]
RDGVAEAEPVARNFELADRLGAVAGWHLAKSLQTVDATSRPAVPGQLRKARILSTGRKPLVQVYHDMGIFWPQIYGQAVGFYAIH